jgi:hypothetical protein
LVARDSLFRGVGDARPTSREVERIGDAIGHPRPEGTRIPCTFPTGPYRPYRSGNRAAETSSHQTAPPPLSLWVQRLLSDSRVDAQKFPRFRGVVAVTAW